MEGVHGIDVSWLHHSQKAQPRRGSLKGDEDKPGEIRTNGAQKQRNRSASEAAASEIKQARTSSATQQSPRPGLFHRKSVEKVPPTQAVATAEGRPGRSPSLSRKSSWLASLGAKFSGNSVATAVETTDHDTEVDGQDAGHDVAEGSSRNKAEKVLGGSPSQKQSSPGFLHSAIRRISSGSSMPYTPSLVERLNPSTRGVVPRRVMNVDPHRDRCSIEELRESKLRRVSFSVDVEIAGTSTYTPEDAHAKLQQDEGSEIKKLDQSEGSALKEGGPSSEPCQPALNGVSSQTSRETDSSHTPTKEPSRKKEKKKKSEEERKERREKEHRQAIEDGQCPLEVSKSTEGNSPVSPINGVSLHRNDRPTTNPLRVYKRCCQLREIRSNTKLVEQLRLSNTTRDGAIDSLDLSNLTLSSSDANAFADFLAIVPIRRLILDSCGLGDEGVRMILAALLATPVPSSAPPPSYEPSSRVDPSADESPHARKGPNQSYVGSRHGAIEKLSLRGNSKIGRDGWGHLALFIYMSHSLRGIDLSMIAFPNDESLASKDHSSKHTTAWLFARALGARLAGDRLEELIMGQCNLSASTLAELLWGVSECGVIRLGLAQNGIKEDGLRSLAAYIAKGRCEGLDLGSNDLRDTLPILIETLNKHQSLIALSLADCNLTPSCLAPLLPRLVELPDFRFIDLSHNRELFATERNVLQLLRRFLPQMQHLKRIHLCDVGLNASLAMALSELLAEIPVIAHINLLDNPELSSLITKRTDEAGQQEAAALFAALMSAAKASTTIICIDIDVPGPDMSDLVKALAKRVVAYCLRNMAQGPIKEYSAAAAQISVPHGGVTVNTPDVLLHLVGPDDPGEEPFVGTGEDQPASELEYLAGGTAIAKALDVCLYNRGRDGWRPSKESIAQGIPPHALEAHADQSKALEMSKNLLLAARKIKARIQPAIRRETPVVDEMSYSKSPSSQRYDSQKLMYHLGRLMFLNQTLTNIIDRFETEYPETRSAQPSVPTASQNINDAAIAPIFGASGAQPLSDQEDLESEVPPSQRTAVALPRRPSEISLSARNMTAEEGRAHRFGQHLQRDVLPQRLGEEPEADHVAMLRQKLSAIPGNEIQKRLNEYNDPEAAIRSLQQDSSALRRLREEDEEGFRMFGECELLVRGGHEGVLSVPEPGERRGADGAVAGPGTAVKPPVEERPSHETIVWEA